MTNINYKKLVKDLRKDITKQFGKKCKVYVLGCFCCMAHRVVDDLEEVVKWLEGSD